jgi:hypothetical protein
VLFRSIALEGMMLNGALAYVLGAYFTGNAWAGVAAALAAGPVQVLRPHHRRAVVIAVLDALSAPP